MFRTMAAMATAAVLALGVGACGDDEEQPTTPAASSQPEPVAQIDALSGQKTAVALDSGFVEALGTLKLTPAPVVTARSPRPASQASRSRAAT